MVQVYMSCRSLGNWKQNLGHRWTLEISIHLHFALYIFPHD